VLPAALAPVLGQPVVVRNRGGAIGTIGAAAIAAATPDGGTVGFVATAALTALATWRLLAVSDAATYVPHALKLAATPTEAGGLPTPVCASPLAPTASPL